MDWVIRYLAAEMDNWSYCSFAIAYCRRKDVATISWRARHCQASRTMVSLPSDWIIWYLLSQLHWVTKLLIIIAFSIWRLILLLPWYSSCRSKWASCIRQHPIQSSRSKKLSMLIIHGMILVWLGKTGRDNGLWSICPWWKQVPWAWAVDKYARYHHKYVFAISCHRTSHSTFLWMDDRQDSMV